jgi:transposase
LRAYQRTYPDRVRAYFRATGLSAVEIAVQFGVSERTAQDWLEGVVGAHGAVV